MEIYDPIKKIARAAWDSRDEHKAMVALEKILRFIEKEDENFRLRQKYYEQI